MCSNLCEKTKQEIRTTQICTSKLVDLAFISRPVPNLRGPKRELAAASDFPLREKRMSRIDLSQKRSLQLPVTEA